MIAEIMETHKKEVEDYCRTNGLSIKKVFSTHRACGNGWEFLQYVDPAIRQRGLGLRGDCAVPAPSMLEIYLEGGTLRFKQTEHTHRLLADEPVAVAVKREPARKPAISVKRKTARAAAMEAVPA